MKIKSILVSIAVLISAVSMAQGNSSFGIRAGINFQNINGKDNDGNKLENTLTTGFNAGINGELPVGADFYLQPGVLFSIKGAKLKNYGYMGRVMNGTLKLSYVEIPINLIYKPVLGNGRMLLGFGPYIAFGIGGEGEVTNPSPTTDYNVEYKKDATTADITSTPFYYKPMDAGANILVGYEFGSNLSFQLNSQLGLSKINSKLNGSHTGEAAHRNTGFGLSIGYRF